MAQKQQVPVSKVVESGMRLYRLVAIYIVTTLV